MTIDWNKQLWRYFDASDSLSSVEWQSLQQWLASDNANLKRFHEFAMIHDQLRGALLAQVAVVYHKQPALADSGRFRQRFVLISVDAFCPLLRWRPPSRCSGLSGVEATQCMPARSSLGD